VHDSCPWTFAEKDYCQRWPQPPRQEKMEPAYHMVTIKTKAIKVNHTWSTSVQTIWDRPFDFGRHLFSSQRSDAYQLPSEEKKERGRTYFLLARGTSSSSSSWIKAVVVAFQVGLRLQENSGQGQK